MAEPFITLSSESTTDASASDSSDETTPLSTPPSTTHDTSRASFHVKDLEEFAKSLQNAADRAFPNQGRAQTRYKEVSVLLLRWEDDEMNVDWELHDLKNVFMEYGFNTEKWLIPTKNPHLKLMSKAIEVVEQHSDQDNLVIIYYAGHALINNSRQATWTCKSDVGYASLEWSAIQTLFEKANFDVLLLLDCCAAASAAPTVGSAVTETIAACGFENSAPQPGRHSFTNTLIEVLEDWIDSPPFSAAMLHNKVLSVLKHERPERAQSGKRRKVECRRTPIHIMGTADPRLPSVELARRVPSPEYLTERKPPTISTQEPSQSMPPSSKQNGYHLEDLHHLNGEDFNVPRVIISLALEEDQNLNSKTCDKWLSSCPALVKFAKVEAVYKSFSTLLLLSVPIFIWNILPEDPACSFVGYATSTNLMSLSPKCSKAELLEQAPVAIAMDGVKSPKENEGKILLQSCLACHKRKIKCDASRPSCRKCKQGGRACVYPIREKKVMVKESYLRSLEQNQQSLMAPRRKEAAIETINSGVKSSASHFETLTNANAPDNSPHEVETSQRPSLRPSLPTRTSLTAHLDQPTNEAVDPAQHDWDRIVDTCFPSETGTEPQDWIFNFDSPIPPLDSYERHLKTNSPDHTTTFDETDRNSFYATTALDDFAPWSMNKKASNVSESEETVLDRKEPLHPESTQEAHNRVPVLPESTERTNDELSSMTKLPPPKKGKTASDLERKLQAAKKILLGDKHGIDSHLTSESSSKLRKVTATGKLAQQNYPKNDWGEIAADIAENGGRRRIQNRVAQRKYREKLKDRLETLDKRAQTRATSADIDIADMDIDDEFAGQPWGSLNLKRQTEGKPPQAATASLPQRSTDTKPMVTKEEGKGKTLGAGNTSLPRHLVGMNSKANLLSQSMEMRALQDLEIHELPAVEPVGLELNTPSNGTIDPIEEWP